MCVRWVCLSIFVLLGCDHVDPWRVPMRLVRCHCFPREDVCIIWYMFYVCLWRGKFCNFSNDDGAPRSLCVSPGVSVFVSFDVGYCDACLPKGAARSRRSIRRS